MKKCTKCKIEKPESEFLKSTCLKSGLRSECKSCTRDMVRNYQREYQKMYRKKNPEKAKAIDHRYKDNHKDKIRGYEKTDERKIYRKNRNKKLRQTNPLFKMKAYLVTRTAKAFKRFSIEKTARTNELLGTNYDIVKAHIEQQFKEGMTWQNYGEWHVDHIMPLASAKDLDELVALCHYSNLQPLWAVENRLKSDKVLSSDLR